MGHHARPPHGSRFPVLITLSGRREAAFLRAEAVFREIHAAFAVVKAARGAPVRVVHFGVRDGEMHLLVEAHDRRALSRGVQGLAVRLARAVNRAMKRRGSVWAHRYVARELATSREVRSALVHVLGGGMGGARGTARRAPDPCTSAAWFDGWRRPFRSGAPEGACPVAAPRTWLAAGAWRKHGLLLFDEPAPAHPRLTRAPATPALTARPKRALGPARGA